ncbi:MAG: hypothetical protein JO000_29555 [Alphaproteobacteria bacterium]|nr:hypothetical protein [Alphaproteobacteria bacterium]
MVAGHWLRTAGFVLLAAALLGYAGYIVFELCKAEISLKSVDPLCRTVQLDHAAAPGSSPREAPKSIVEQYKAYVADLAAFGAQHASVQTFYLTIISALIAALAFAERGRPIRELFNAVSIFVLVAIATIIASWLFTEIRFAVNFRAKFNVLCDMEKHYPGFLFPMFAEQSQIYFRSGEGGIIGAQLLVLAGAAVLALGMALFGIVLCWRGAREPPDVTV